MKKETASEKFSKVEEYTILQPCMVLESGKKVAEKKQVGDKVQVEGNDKAALYATGKGVATSSLNDSHKAVMAKAAPVKK